MTNFFWEWLHLALPAGMRHIVYWSGSVKTCAMCVDFFQEVRASDAEQSQPQYVGFGTALCSMPDMSNITMCCKVQGSEHMI